jgi:hypothetical protein
MTIIKTTAFYGQFYVLYTDMFFGKVMHSLCWAALHFFIMYGALLIHDYNYIQLAVYLVECHILYAVHLRRPECSEWERSLCSATNCLEAMYLIGNYAFYRGLHFAPIQWDEAYYWYIFNAILFTNLSSKLSFLTKFQDRVIKFKFVRELGNPLKFSLWLFLAWSEYHKFQCVPDCV